VLSRYPLTLISTKGKTETILLKNDRKITILRVFNLFIPKYLFCFSLQNDQLFFFSIIDEEFVTEKKSQKLIIKLSE